MKKIDRKEKEKTGRRRPGPQPARRQSPSIDAAQGELPRPPSLPKRVL